MSSGGHVYIMTDHMRRVLYIGVTADLPARFYQHQQGQSGFTSRYGLNVQVHVETYDDIRTAIQREKNLKRWVRAWKVALIEQHNPMWADLSLNLLN